MSQPPAPSFLHLDLIFGLTQAPEYHIRSRLNGFMLRNEQE